MREYYGENSQNVFVFQNCQFWCSFWTRNIAKIRGKMLRFIFGRHWTKRGEHPLTFPFHPFFIHFHLLAQNIEWQLCLPHMCHSQLECRPYDKKIYYIGKCENKMNNKKVKSCWWGKGWEMWIWIEVGGSFSSPSLYGPMANWLYPLFPFHFHFQPIFCFYCHFPLSPFFHLVPWDIGLIMGRSRLIRFGHVPSLFWPKRRP